MSLGLFLTGLAIGFSIAAPVGPVGLMCIQRTLSGGRLNGLFTGANIGKMLVKISEPGI